MCRAVCGLWSHEAICPPLPPNPFPGSSDHWSPLHIYKINFLTSHVQVRTPCTCLSEPHLLYLTCSTSAHGPTNDRSLFLGEKIVSVPYCMCTPVSLSMSPQLDSSVIPCLGYCEHCDKHVEVVYLGYSDCVSFRWTLSDETDGPVGAVVLVFEDSPYFFPQWLAYFTFFPAVFQSCQTLHLCQHLSFWGWSFYRSHSIQGNVTSYCSYKLHFPDNNHAEFFIYLLMIFVSTFG